MTSKNSFALQKFFFRILFPSFVFSVIRCCRWFSPTYSLVAQSLPHETHNNSFWKCSKDGWRVRAWARAHVCVYSMMPRCVSNAICSNLKMCAIMQAVAYKARTIVWCCLCVVIYLPYSSCFASDCNRIACTNITLVSPRSHISDHRTQFYAKSHNVWDSLCCILSLRCHINTLL